MRDNLKDIIEHTVSLGNIEVLKVIGTASDTIIKTTSVDRAVVATGRFKTANPDFVGTFGCPILENSRPF